MEELGIQSVLSSISAETERKLNESKISLNPQNNSEARNSSDDCVNINNILKSPSLPPDEKTHSALEKPQAIFDFNSFDKNFNSRDLVKIFLYLSTSKVENQYDLSMKGIKFWELLSQNKKFEFLFNRYKPWSLHTSYKRLFSHATYNEVLEEFLKDENCDIISLTNFFKNGRKHESKINHKIYKPIKTQVGFQESKLLQRKTKRSRLNYHNYYNYQHNKEVKSEIEDEIYIDLSQVEYEENSLNNTNKLNQNKNKLLDPFCFFSNRMNKLFNKEYEYLIHGVGESSKEGLSDHLSDHMDQIENLRRDEIKSKSNLFKIQLWIIPI
jgi:hypothetical protein